MTTLTHILSILDLTYNSHKIDFFLKDEHLTCWYSERDRYQIPPPPLNPFPP